MHTQPRLRHLLELSQVLDCTRSSYHSIPFHQQTSKLMRHRNQIFTNGKINRIVIILLNYSERFFEYNDDLCFQI